jgi:anti-anti-sigma regulatory factor
MKLATRARSTITTLKTIDLPERFDVHEIEEFLAKVHHCHAGDVISLDVSEVRFLDESGINALLESQRWSRANGISVRPLSQSLCAQITLELTGHVDELWPVAHSPQAAA